MSGTEFGHWPTTLHNVLEAASGIAIASHSIPKGVQRDLMFDALHSALIAAEECRQAMKEIAATPNPQEKDT